MVICPRCEQHVDETVRTTCPLCFTPLPIPGNEQAAAPQAGPTTVAPVNISTQAPPPPVPAGLGAMPPAAPPQAPGIGVRPQQAPQASAPPPSTSRPGARVSLTGEVYDENMQNNNLPPPNYVGGTMPTTRPGPTPARPPGPARPTSPSADRRKPVEAPAKSGSGATMAVVVVLVLALLGGGGWWFLKLRTNPKDQVEKFYVAVKAMDWETVYNMMDWPDEIKKDIPDGKSFAQDFQRTVSADPAAGNALKQIFGSMQVKKIGEPTFADGEAQVPITLATTMFGQQIEQNENVRLKNHNGIWKLQANTNYSNFARMFKNGLGRGGGVGNFGGNIPGRGGP